MYILTFHYIPLHTTVRFWTGPPYCIRTLWIASNVFAVLSVLLYLWDFSKEKSYCLNILCWSYCWSLRGILQGRGTDQNQIVKWIWERGFRTFKFYFISCILMTPMGNIRLEFTPSYLISSVKSFYYQATCSKIWPDILSPNSFLNTPFMQS